VKGPALIIEPNQTIVVEPGWQAAINPPRPCRADPLRKARPREFAIGTTRPIR
jgi:5-oxoprolinase (ATP-hydrolysing)